MGSHHHHIGLIVFNESQADVRAFFHSNRALLEALLRNGRADWSRHPERRIRLLSRTNPLNSCCGADNMRQMFNKLGHGCHLAA